MMKYKAKTFLLLFACLSFAAMKCDNGAEPVDPNDGPSTGIRVDTKNLALLEGQCGAVDKSTFRDTLLDANTRTVQFSWQPVPGVDSYSGTLFKDGVIVDNFQVTTPTWSKVGLATGSYNMELRSHCQSLVSIIVIEKIVVK